MKDLCAAVRRAIGKGAALRRSAALELMAYGGPTGDPRVAADLSTVRVRVMADRLNWTPTRDSALHLCTAVADTRPDFQVSVKISWLERHRRDAGGIGARDAGNLGMGGIA
eukprot:1703428-Amphidinium_carterae.2